MDGILEKFVMKCFMDMGYWSMNKCIQIITILTIIIMIGINIWGGFIKGNFRIIVNMVMGYSIFLVIFILGNLLIINLKIKMGFLFGKIMIYTWVVLLMEWSMGKVDGNLVKIIIKDLGNLIDLKV